MRNIELNEAYQSLDIPDAIRGMAQRATDRANEIVDQALGMAEFAEAQEKSGQPVIDPQFADLMSPDDRETLMSMGELLLAWEFYDVWVMKQHGDNDHDPKYAQFGAFVIDSILLYDETKKGAT